MKKCFTLVYRYDPELGIWCIKDNTRGQAGHKVLTYAYSIISLRGKDTGDTRFRQEKGRTRQVAGRCRQATGHF